MSIKVKHDLTTWGLNIDIYGLIVMAAMMALAFVINSFTIFVGPGLTWSFGGFLTQMIAVMLGPIWAGLAAAIGITYHGLILWGAPDVIPGAFVDLFVFALLHKKVPLPLCGMLTMLITWPMWWWMRTYIDGYPLLFAAQISVKAALQFTFSGIVAQIVFSLPRVNQYLPFIYDCRLARTLVAKMD
ncbi:MAG: hypothetical protein ACXACA_03580 [Candidatus Ranarchaeia archaeon]|jgi:hypothetical protein